MDTKSKHGVTGHIFGSKEDVIHIFGYRDDIMIIIMMMEYQTLH
jgi:hypothetical protein